MSQKTVLTGNGAVVEAVRQVHPDVVMSYPIQPMVPIGDMLALSIANGRLDAEFVQTESGVSAMSGCIGAAAAGSRVFTASSAQCLATMQELLLVASSLRLPIVAAITNRAMAAPENILPDHSDTMSQRDNGWIQIYAENPQEAYDNVIQAYKLAELQTVLTPVMVAMDGFVTSHTSENITLEDATAINGFVGKYVSRHSLLDVNSPVTMGSLADADYYFEQKINQNQGLEHARQAIKEIGKEYGDRFGRYYGHFEAYRLDDARTAIFTLASTAGTVKESVDRLREQGEAVGLLKLRVFRPFPYVELAESLAHLESIAVLDRCMAPGSFGGPLFAELRSALYDLHPRPRILPFVFGLGGREISNDDIERIFTGIKEKSQRVDLNGEPLALATAPHLVAERVGNPFGNTRKLTENIIGNGDVGFINARI